MRCELVDLHCGHSACFSKYGTIFFIHLGTSCYWIVKSSFCMLPYMLCLLIPFRSNNLKVAAAFYIIIWHLCACMFPDLQGMRHCLSCVILASTSCLSRWSWQVISGFFFFWFFSPPYYGISFCDTSDMQHSCGCSREKWTKLNLPNENASQRLSLFDLKCKAFVFISGLISFQMQSLNDRSRHGNHLGCRITLLYDRIMDRDRTCSDKKPRPDYLVLPDKCCSLILWHAAVGLKSMEESWFCSEL